MMFAPHPALPRGRTWLCDGLAGLCLLLSLLSALAMLADAVLVWRAGSLPLVAILAYNAYDYLLLPILLLALLAGYLSRRLACHLITLPAWRQVATLGIWISIGVLAGIVLLFCIMTAAFLV